jgi:hypothetical protein
MTSEQSSSRGEHRGRKKEHLLALGVPGVGVDAARKHHHVGLV